MSAGISIIVCCYNGEKKLEPTLRGLSQLELPDGAGVELIFVDNNSTDNTVAFTRQYWEQAGSRYPIRVLTETKQGVGFARMSGVAAASYDIVLFVDDDNELRSDYLKNGYEILRANPGIGIVGGISHGAFDGPLPAWMNPVWPFKSLLNSLAVTSPDTSHTGYLPKGRQFLFSAATFYRKQIFDEVSRLNHPLMLKSRTGNALLSGEDEEFCCWAQMMGFRLYRSDQLHFNHNIGSGRLTQAYFERLFHGFGYSDLILQTYRKSLAGDKSYPDFKAVCLRSKVKTAILKIAYAGLRPVLGDRVFKLRLLVEFETGKRQFMEENDQFPQLHVAISTLSDKLAIR